MLTAPRSGFQPFVIILSRLAQYQTDLRFPERSWSPEFTALVNVTKDAFDLDNAQLVLWLTLYQVDPGLFQMVQSLSHPVEAINHILGVTPLTHLLT